MQTETTMRCHYILSELGRGGSLIIPNGDKDKEQLECSCIASRNAKWYNFVFFKWYKNNLAVFIKVK